MEVKPGDVVMLKSGGQPLTVAEVNKDNVVCLWMGVEGDLFRETLPLATLDILDPEDEEEDDEDEQDDEDEDESEDDEDEDEEPKKKKRA